MERRRRNKKWGNKRKKENAPCGGRNGSKKKESLDETSHEIVAEEQRKKKKKVKETEKDLRAYRIKKNPPDIKKGKTTTQALQSGSHNGGTSWRRGDRTLNNYMSHIRRRMQPGNAGEKR